MMIAKRLILLVAGPFLVLIGIWATARELVRVEAPARLGDVSFDRGQWLLNDFRTMSWEWIAGVDQVWRSNAHRGNQQDHRQQHSLVRS